MKTFDWCEVWSKVVTLVESLPTICGMSYACTYFKAIFLFLMGGNQIGTLILNVPYGHNVFYVLKWVMQTYFRHLKFLRNFQWYKKLFDPTSFDPWNTSLNIWDSIGIPILKVGVHLGVCGFIPSHSWECKCDSRVALSSPTFPCLCLGWEPKVKGVTIHECH
jgi:hypothetical protein